MIKIEESSDNVYVDLGMADADKMTVKAKLYGVQSLIDSE